MARMAILRKRVVSCLQLPLPGRNGSNCSREGFMGSRIHRLVSNDRARRMVAEVISSFPGSRGTHGARSKSTPAVRADIAKNAFHAVRTKGAFKAADARIRRVRRQGLVTMFTSRSKFKHGAAPISLKPGGMNSSASMSCGIDSRMHAWPYSTSSGSRLYAGQLALFFRTRTSAKSRLTTRLPKSTMSASNRPATVPSPGPGRHRR